jgi:hypothetical protein
MRMAYDFPACESSPPVPSLPHAASRVVEDILYHFLALTLVFTVLSYLPVMFIPSHVVGNMSLHSLAGAAIGGSLVFWFCKCSSPSIVLLLILHPSPHKQIHKHSPVFAIACILCCADTPGILSIPSERYRLNTQNSSSLPP